MIEIIKQLTLLITVIIILGNTGFNQTKSGIVLEKTESPYDVINLKFVLDSALKPEDVGFDNPKSYWEFSYELRCLAETFKYENFVEKENESQAERLKRN